ncbi:hypothetical protein H0X06_01110 [Candidatus Dependentiae bacterium]|nr:hypothetical protein [Candidatus Dependentiae bacterium]
MNRMKTLLYCVLINGLFLISGDLSAWPSGSDLYSGTTSSNFITRWGFQLLCNHQFDPRTGKNDWATTMAPGGVSFDPAVVKAGDIIFVRKIELFMQMMHPQITVPYIIITHGDFLETNEDEKLRYLDHEKIIAWFSIHPPKAWHIKYFPIPLGVYQKKDLFVRQKELSALFKQLRDKPKTHLLSGIFDTTLVPERAKLAKLFKEKPFYTASKSGMSFERYMKTLASSVFTLSPRGWGPDCYRTWEALLVGTIPIVKRGESGILERAKNNLRNYFFPFNETIHAQLDRLYDNLPVLVIDDWDEITEEFLKKKYKEITSKKYNINMLYIEYWHNIILTVQKEYLKNYISHPPQLTKTVKKNDKESSNAHPARLKKSKQKAVALNKTEKETDIGVSTAQSEYLLKRKENPLNAPMTDITIPLTDKENLKYLYNDSNEYLRKPQYNPAFTVQKDTELTAAQILYLNKYKLNSSPLEKTEKENDKELYTAENEFIHKVKASSSRRKRRKERNKKLSAEIEEYAKKLDQNVVV